MFSKEHLARLQACCGLPVTEPEPTEKRVIEETVIPVLDKYNCVMGHKIRQLCDDGTVQYVDAETLETEINAMGANFTTYKPTADSVQCRTAQVTTFEVVPGTYTVGDIIAAALAADPQTYDFAGNTVDALPEDAYDFNIVSKACGDSNSAGEEVLVDYMTVDGNNMVTFNDPEDGGVDAGTEIVIPATGCAVASICLKKCLDKEAIAALGG